MSTILPGLEVVQYTIQYSTIFTIIIPLCILIVGVVIYNSLVKLSQQVNEAWADIDTQLKRRFDLIPNLIETIKGATKFESTTLENVIKARNSAMAGGSHADIGKAEGELGGVLKSIFALTESYPDLKSNQNYLNLQNELADTENKLQSARRFYNGNVKEYNTKIKTVPANLVAKLFSFGEREFFELGDDEQAARNPVAVTF